MSFWDLHGPSEFLSEIEADLRANRAVMVALPRTGPTGFSESLASRLDRTGWHRVNLAWRPGDHPTDFLFRELHIELKLSERQSPQMLVAALPSMAILIEGIEQQDWAAWKRFLGAYEQELRRKADVDRPLLVCVLDGIEPDEAKLHTPALALHSWVGVMSEMDMLVYVRSLLNKDKVVGLERDISLRVIAKLALWDVETARMLVQLSAKELARPDGVLKEVAQGRKWGAGTASRWADGSLNFIDGREMPHSAWLSLNDRFGELGVRIWGAQASVALPLVEQRRRELVPRASRYLRFPLKIDGEIIMHAYDLEVGRLSHLLVVAGCRDKELMRRLRLLKSVRNTLAHVEVVDPNLLFDKDLVEASG